VEEREGTQRVADSRERNIERDNVEKSRNICHNAANKNGFFYLSGVHPLFDKLGIYKGGATYYATLIIYFLTIAPYVPHNFHVLVSLTKWLCTTTFRLQTRNWFFDINWICYIYSNNERLTQVKV
jgi:hypothetical protein